jgi:hypothetical protein
MLYALCFFVFVFDVCLSANRKKLGGCFPLYSKDCSPRSDRGYQSSYAILRNLPHRGRLQRQSTL